MANVAEDVEVILTHDMRPRFHASVLARHSPRFASLLTEPNAAKLGNRARNAGVKIRWMFILTDVPTNDNPGELELVPLDKFGEPAVRIYPLVVNENGRVPTRGVQHYLQILRSFYGNEITIADEDMTEALADSISMVGIAEYLECVSSISKPVEVSLLKHGQLLYRAIQSKPWAWVDMAYNIKSEIIFKEVVIHLAGNWRKISSQKNAMAHLKDKCPHSVRALCEHHHNQIVLKGRKLELAISSQYPGGMCEPSSQLPIKREEYSKDILIWMALCWFRHWLGQRIICEQGSAGSDSGFELYSQLAAAGDAYMDKNIINQFHLKFPMTKKALNVLENHLLELKECIKGKVQEHGILKSYCQLDTHRYPLDYLTCVDIKKEELPWLQEDEEAPAQSKKRGQLAQISNVVSSRNQTARKRLAQLDDPRDMSDGDDEDSEGFGRSKRTRLN